MGRLIEREPPIKTKKLKNKHYLHKRKTKNQICPKEMTGLGTTERERQTD